MFALLTVAFHLSSAVAQTAVPAWLFPVNPPAVARADGPDAITALRLPDVQVTFTALQLSDLFLAPDWYPATHSRMPSIVAYGHPPDVYACGFCHSPSGQGRPENASLAGLPAQYILQQISDFRTGLRRGAWPGDYRPADRMIQSAMHLSDAEGSIAAEYFARQRLHERTRVRETRTIPVVSISSWVYTVTPGSKAEALDERLIEVAPDAARHAKLDDRMPYVAYVPKGSIARGRELAWRGIHGSATACVTCHGRALQGVDLIPPIAGRSPTYILRQLLAFQTMRRRGAGAAAMQPVVDGLTLADMIAAAAYAASLKP